MNLLRYEGIQAPALGSALSHIHHVYAVAARVPATKSMSGGSSQTLAYHFRSLVVIEQGAENDNGGFLPSGHDIRIGGQDQGTHVRGHQLQVWVLREELVDLFFEGRHRRLAGGQLMENDFKCFYFHFAFLV